MEVLRVKKKISIVTLILIANYSYKQGWGRELCQSASKLKAQNENDGKDKYCE